MKMNFSEAALQKLSKILTAHSRYDNLRLRLRAFSPSQDSAGDRSRDRELDTVSLSYVDVAYLREKFQAVAEKHGVKEGEEIAVDAEVGQGYFVAGYLPVLDFKKGMVDELRKTKSLPAFMFRPPMLAIDLKPDNLLVTGDSFHYYGNKIVMARDYMRLVGAGMMADLVDVDWAALSLHTSPCIRITGNVKPEPVFVEDFVRGLQVKKT